MKSDAIIQKIKDRVAAVDANGPRKILGVFQLNIKLAEGVHHWIVDLKELKVTEGSATGPDCTINISDEDFVLIGTKQLTIEEAVAAGKVEVLGEKSLAVALMEHIK